MLEFQRLYPQYQTTTDRRKQNVPVAFERRSGEDRRTQERVALDTNLTRDIFQVKNSIVNIQKTAPQKIENVSKAATNTIKADQFIKEQKINDSSKIEKPQEPISASTIMGTILGVGLVGIVASTFLGTVGAVFSVCLGAYCGGKMLKQAIVAHLVDENIKNKK